VRHGLDAKALGDLRFVALRDDPDFRALAAQTGRCLPVPPVWVADPVPDTSE
jgi:hypothetical protein